MNYVTRMNCVDAQFVELAGQRLYVVAVAGEAYMLSADVFELFFEPYTPPSIDPPRKPLHDNPKQVQPRSTKKIDVAQRCLNILRSHGPLTTAELRDHVYSDLKDPRKRLQNFSALSLDMRRRRLIERREDPATQLDKWHIVEATHAGN